MYGHAPALRGRPAVRRHHWIGSDQGKQPGREREDDPADVTGRREADAKPGQGERNIFFRWSMTASFFAQSFSASCAAGPAIVARGAPRGGGSGGRSSRAPCRSSLAATPSVSSGSWWRQLARAKTRSPPCSRYCHPCPAAPWRGKGRVRHSVGARSKPPRPERDRRVEGPGHGATGPASPGPESGPDFPTVVAISVRSRVRRSPKGAAHSLRARRRQWPLPTRRSSSPRSSSALPT